MFIPLKMLFFIGIDPYPLFWTDAVQWTCVLLVNPSGSLNTSRIVDENPELRAETRYGFAYGRDDFGRGNASLVRADVDGLKCKHVSQGA